MKRLFLFVWLLPLLTHTEGKLPGVFTDHLVLQRDAAVPVLGWSAAGEEVTVEFAGPKKTAKTDANGKWLVKPDPMPASDLPPYLLFASMPKSKSSNHEC